MKRINLKKVLLTTMLSGAFIGSASAGDLTISDIVGGWENAVAGSSTPVITNQGGQLVDTITWGSGPAGPSGYTFDPIDGSYTIPTGTPLGTAFLLGDFAHANNPIGLGQAISSVDYDFSFTVNGDVVTSLGTTLTYLHDETNNSCDGADCADDIVEITNVIINELIVVGEDTYFFNLLGFSTDGGASTQTTFRSPEGGTNGAGLFGIVTDAPIGVPEPGMLALLGLSLAGFGLSLRKRQRATA